ncbi:MAG: FliA/WhiG family RNA polymerase sigma factor [Ktedonobacterales bacterium]|nr:FliA/WhiG family RNA polymerase sigma factor [Ktedonobacterales bacterium]
MKNPVGIPLGDIDATWMRFVEARNPKLREQLIMHYVHLVRFVVARLGIPSTSTLDADDLLSFGVIGLINAIDRFEPDRGIKFEAYATARIRGAVIDQLRALNWMPRSAVSRSRQLERMLAELEQRLGRPAHEDEIAAEFGVSIDRYRHMLVEAGTSILSLDAPLAPMRSDDDTASLAELLEDASAPSPSEEAERHEQQQQLAAALSRLPPRERLLISLYYDDELTMKEISQIMHVSESRVCQLHAQAVLRLRGHFHVRTSEGTASPPVAATRGKALARAS